MGSCYSFPTMIHPTCGTDLRRSTKVAAMIDSILSGFLVFCGIAVLNNTIAGIRDPDTSVFPVGCMILFVLLMGLEMYLSFRLYRAAHERDIQRLRAWKKAAAAVLGIGTVFVFIFRHTLPNMGPPAPPPPTPIPSPSSPFPLLWFYVAYFIAAIFRFYMFWIVKTFLTEFELS